MSTKRLAPSLALEFICVAAAASALANIPSVHVVVTPKAGSPTTHFLVRYRTPDRLGRSGGSERRDELTATSAGGTSGCLRTFEANAPAAGKDARIRVVLNPARAAGHWCAGKYRGEIEEIQTPVCAPGRACPDYVLLRGVVGRFSFTVRARVARP